MKITFDEQVLARLADWSDADIVLDFDNTIDKKSLAIMDKFLTDKLGLTNGDYVVITGSVPELLVGGTNFIKVHQIINDQRI